MQPHARIETPSVSRTVAPSPNTAMVAAVPTRRSAPEGSSGGLGRRGWFRRLTDGLRGLGRATSVESSAGADPLLAFAAEGVPTPNTPGAAIGSEPSTRRTIIAPVAI